MRGVTYERGDRLRIVPMAVAVKRTKAFSQSRWALITSSSGWLSFNGQEKEEKKKRRRKKKV